MTIARFKDVCIDAPHDGRLETFWAAVLGYEITWRDDGPASLRSPATNSLVWINKVPEPKTVKNRVHLDVHCGSVEELVQLGATVLRDPTETDHWWLMADPDGGEFCAFVRDKVPAERLYEIVVDCVDPNVQAAWWAEVLGAAVHDDGTALEHVPGFAGQYLVFQAVPETRTVKNRVHWDVDLATADGLDELLARGATIEHGPTGQNSWHVLNDPEGNVFCAFPASTD